MIAMTFPVQALTLTSYSEPVLATTSTDQFTGVSVLSSTASTTWPPPTAARAIFSAWALVRNVHGANAAKGCVMIFRTTLLCASTQTSYSWAVPRISTDQIFLSFEPTVSSTACSTCPPPTADTASCSASGLEISAADDWATILRIVAVCASMKTSYSWVESMMSTDQAILPE